MLAPDMGQGVHKGPRVASVFKENDGVPETKNDGVPEAVCPAEVEVAACWEEDRLREP